MKCLQSLLNNFDFDFSKKFVEKILLLTPINIDKPITIIKTYSEKSIYHNLRCTQCIGTFIKSIIIIYITVAHVQAPGTRDLLIIILYNTIIYLYGRSSYCYRIF